MQLDEPFRNLFQVNNIFYVCLRDGYNMEQLCNLSRFSSSKLRKSYSDFFINGVPPSFRDLSLFATHNDLPISKSARIFIYCKNHPDFRLNSQHLEYILFPKEKQFDHFALFNYFRRSHYFDQIIDNYSKIRKLLSPKTSNIFNMQDRNLSDVILNFRNCMRMITNLPDCLKKLSNRQRYFVNMSLSLAYLGANVQIDRGGHSSPHLKGQFLAQVRENNSLSNSRSFRLYY